MEKFLIKNKESLIVLFRNLFFLCIILFFIEKSKLIPINIPFSGTFLVYFSMLLFFFLFVLMMKNYKKKDVVIVLIKILFFISLLLIAISNFVHFLNDQCVFFANILLIFSTMVILHDGQVDCNEKKIKNIFHIIIVVLLLLLSFALRFFNSGYLDGSDNYTAIAIKNIYENGIDFYKYSFISTQLMLIASKIFGYEISSLRIPSIIYSSITVLFAYLLARKINKKIGIITMILFAISPWSIVISRLTRDYSFDAMFSTIVAYFSFSLFKNKKIQFNKKIIIYIILSILITVFSKFINHRGQTLICLVIPAIFILYLLFKKRRSYLLLGVPVLIAFYYFNYTDFGKGIYFNKYYFDIFFNPQAGSPWQWFNANKISTFFLFLFFIAPLFNAIKKKKGTFNFFVFNFFLNTFGFCTKI